jgi:hypothetical protein
MLQKEQDEFIEYLDTKEEKYLCRVSFLSGLRKKIDMGLQDAEMPYIEAVYTKFANNGKLDLVGRKLALLWNCSEPTIRRHVNNYLKQGGSISSKHFILDEGVCERESAVEEREQSLNERQDSIDSKEKSSKELQKSLEEQTELLKQQVKDATRRLSEVEAEIEEKKNELNELTETLKQEYDRVDQALINLNNEINETEKTREQSLKLKEEVQQDLELFKKKLRVPAFARIVGSMLKYFTFDEKVFWLTYVLDWARECGYDDLGDRLKRDDADVRVGKCMIIGGKCSVMVHCFYSPLSHIITLAFGFNSVVCFAMRTDFEGYVNGRIKSPEFVDKYVFVLELIDEFNKEAPGSQQREHILQQLANYAGDPDFCWEHEHVSYLALLKQRSAVLCK